MLEQIESKLFHTSYCHRIVGDEQDLKRIPLLNRIIVCYVGLSALVYALFLISPFVTLVSPTPLHHLQTYMGVIGAVLMGIDLLTNRGLWRGAYVILLYGICAVALVSSVLTLSYGAKDNLFIICWTLIQFSLFYSCAQRMERAELQKYIRVFFSIIVIVWFVACCISVFQYFAQIGYLYVIDPLSDDTAVARQGFIGSRLFGIFNPLNHAVYVSLMLFLGGIYYIIQTKKKAIRVCLIIADVIFLLHIMLSGSRSAEISLLCSAFVASFFYLRNKEKYTSGWKRLGMPVLSAILSVVIVFACFTGIKEVLGHVPTWLGTVENQEDLNSDLLEREGLEDDSSNGRLSIWKDYCSLYGEIGLLGLSPGNYMAYICENNSDLFIVQYIRDTFPEKFAGGIIYHVHNGYLMTFVSTGFLGLFLMLAYLILCLRRVLLHIKYHRRVSDVFTVSFAIVLAGFISAMFDKGLFFMDNPHTFIFWLAAGILIQELSIPDGARLFSHVKTEE